MTLRGSSWGAFLWVALITLTGQSAYEPTFVVRDFSGEWWQQILVEPAAAAVEMEVVEGERWALRAQAWGDFTSGAHIATGTPVQLFATRVDGVGAASPVFSYFLE